MKNSKEKILIILATLIAVILGIAIVVTNYNRSDNYQIKKHIDRGNQYINDLDFENAIVEYLIVVNIDDTNVEAYMKIAEAYHNLEDFEKEKKILKVGYNKTEDIEIKEYLDKILEAERVQEANDSEKITEGVVKGNTEENDEPRRRNLAIDAYYDFLSKPVFVWSDEYSFSTINTRFRFALADIVSNEFPMLIVENTEASHMDGWYRLYAYIDGNIHNILPNALGDVIGYYENGGIYFVGYGMQGSYREDYYSVNPIDGTVFLIASRQGYDEFEEIQDEEVFTDFFINVDGQNTSQITYNSSKEEFLSYINEKVGDSERVLFDCTEWGNWLYESNGMLYDNSAKNKELLLEMKKEQ